MFKCKICGKEFKKHQSLGAHNISHTEGFVKYVKSLVKEKVIKKKTCPKCNKIFKIEVISSSNDKGKKFCSRSCANSRVQTKEMNEKKRLKLKGVKKKKPLYCIECGKEIISKKGYCQKCYIKNPNLKKKLSENGGYRKGSGRSKGGYYKRIWCHSTYELAYLIYCLDHRIKIKKCTEYFKYIYKGKEYSYNPDFVVNDDLIVEIKGYWTPLVEVKSKSVKNRNYKIYYYDKIKNYIKYVKDTYKVKKLYELYDNYKPKYTYKCFYCGKIYLSEVKKVKKVNYCTRRCAGLNFKNKRTKNIAG